MRTYKSDAKVSLDRFNKIIKSKLEELLKSKVTSLEEYTLDSKDDILKAFIKEIDMYSGVDAVRFKESLGFQFIASRIQTIKDGFKPYNTFTIRFERDNNETEFSKRIMQIKNDYIYPTLTIQAYVNEDDFLLSMGVVKTKDMYLYAENNLDKLKKVKNIDNSSSFIIITFNELKNKCDMIIYECGGSKFYKKP